MTQALIMDKGEQFYGKKKQWPPKNDKNKGKWAEDQDITNFSLYCNKHGINAVLYNFIDGF